MQITDIDLTTDPTEIRVEINHNQYQTIPVTDFLGWLVDKYIWFFDADRVLVSIPDVSMRYSELVQAYVCTTANVNTYTWVQFHKQYRHKISKWLQSYVNEHFDFDYFEPVNEMEEIDAAIEWRRKFGK